MIEQTNKLLHDICKNLSKHRLFESKGACNYCVNAKIFQSEEVEYVDEIDLIEKTLFSKGKVSDIELSNLPELLNSVKEGFEFSGDAVSYPNQNFLSSAEFTRQLKNALEKIEDLCRGNSAVFKFWLVDEGHPFYPVYWDYAFLVKKVEDSFILIGSSSD